jgi:DNA methylase
MKMRNDYNEFILRKVKTIPPSGFEPIPTITPLFDWQKLLVEWAVRLGKAALFADCGLGKTIMQLEWARQIHAQSGGDVLILTPLAVAAQTVAEGAKFGVPVTMCRGVADVRPGVNIINYQRLDEFDTSGFSGVVLDESSILKDFTGRTRIMLTERFARTPYKLCCSATPAPNDFTELGQHAEFLGVCSSMQMLATYFINDTFDTGTWRLKGHAEDAFWQWVASWAACLSKPSDIGFSDEGFILPAVHTHTVTVHVDQRAEAGSGELFRVGNLSATQLHAENRRTVKDRVDAAARIVNATDEPFVVWCYSNEESEMLTTAILGAVEVRGDLSIETKEERLNLFSTGQARVIVSKGSIAGRGMNWQHCRNEIYVGLNHSFETFYQSSRRIYRFGQKREINRYIVQTDSESGTMASIVRKQAQHESMRELVKFTFENLTKGKKMITLNTDIKKKESGRWTVYNGDCVRVAETLPSDSIGFSVFSPPFADLFTYSADVQDMGNCNGLGEFMVQFEYLVDQLLRITMPGRLCAVHCLDLLSAKWKTGAIELQDFSGEIVRAFRSKGWLFNSRITIWKDPVTEMQRTKAHGLLYKTLKKDSADSRVGVPEYMLVFRKRGDNPVPIGHTPEDFPLDRWQEIASPVWMTVDQGRVLNGKLATDQRDERHICPLQLDVIERALLLWSAPDDLVFSPFTGIGSEGYCAMKMGRRFVGAELKESYWMTACDYLKQAEAEAETLFKLS